MEIVLVVVGMVIVEVVLVVVVVVVVEVVLVVVKGKVVVVVVVVNVVGSGLISTSIIGNGKPVTLRKNGA